MKPVVPKNRECTGQVLPILIAMRNRSRLIVWPSERERGNGYVSRLASSRLPRCLEAT